ncbi:hypothetical protein CIHG_08943 [Coccidioides immitis H538.4]|uniref:Uncharacterized protein n=1 Tax=Coccidioides immitis H538.4 TaxID=396776 RepID=A0A0J8S1D4_COCIT|nr:hypothetical protein CIHG_08943 [Coccidioides immitis H538.4]
MHVDGVVGWPSVWLVKLDNLVGANEISELGLSIPVKLIASFSYWKQFSRKGIHATKVRDSQQGNTKMCVIFEYVPPPFHAPHRRHRASFDSSVKSMRAANGIGREIHASPCSRY